MYRKPLNEQGQCPGGTGIFIACPNRPMGPQSRVLVVDDEPAIRALVAKIIERAGLQVESARDGAEAIEKLESQRYGVIVLDLMMPNVDGFALIDYIRERNAPRPAIIVISAGEPAAIRHLDGTLVHSVLRKPFDIDVLGDLVVAAAQSMATADDDRQQHRGGVIPFRRGENAC